jgi:putative peptidoglycan lipid II flippase
MSVFEELPVEPAGAPLTRRSGAFIGSVNLGARALDRLAAFAQIIVIAAIFGASSKADLYFIAGIVPLTIGTIVGEPLGRGFMALLLGQRDRERALAVAATGLALSTAALFFLTCVYLAVVYSVVHATSPAGSPSVAPWFAFAVLAPALGVSGYLGGVLLWLEHYVWDALRFPLSSLFGLAFLGVATAASGRVVWAAAAISAGYVVTVVIALAVVAGKLGIRWLGRIDREALRVVGRAHRTLISPMLGGAVGGQVIVMLERVLAATLSPGAVATLSYARGIASAPSVVSQAIGAGAYPGIARADAAGSTKAVQNSFVIGLRLNLFVGGVFAVYLGVYAVSVTGFFLERGAFNAASATRAGHALAAFALSTLATSVLMYVVAVLYGVGAFTGLLYRSLAVFGAYVVLAPVLLILFAGTGLALAFSIAQTIGAFLAVLLVARWLGLPMRELEVRSIRPVVPRLGVVAAALVAYRIALSFVQVPVAWRGTFYVGGSAALMLVVSATVLLSAPLPESIRLRQIARRALSPTATRRVRPEP